MPRSPSRDRSDPYTGNRGYFHQLRGVHRAKAVLAVAALGVVVGWVGYDWAAPARAVYSHTHGPLSHAHAAWESTCEVCHRSASGADFARNPLSVFTARDRWHDLTCEKCHAGPAHHAALGDEERAFHNRCSNCHHDHDGRENPLVKLTDDHCVRCHANLPDHRIGPTPFAPTITRFAKDHPEFRRLVDHPPGTPYPRALKFSHALHMTPGLVYKPATEGKDEAWTLAKLERLSGRPAADRYRQPGRPDAAAVALDCSSCHQLDSGTAGPVARPDDPDARKFDLLTQALAGQPRESILPPRTAGTYYLPVNFDAHCKSCHPVRSPAGVASGAFVVGEFDLPHRKQPGELEQVLKGEYANRLAAGSHPALAAVVGPGGRLDPPDPGPPAGFHQEIDRLSGQALKTLFLGSNPPDATGQLIGGGYACGKCHDTTGPANTVAELRRVRVAPMGSPTVWFPHARFDHPSHRALTCATCHPGTGPGFAPNGLVDEREPIRISGVASCQACHSPAGTKFLAPGGAATVGGGIRHGCTDCHQYHNGDHPLQGRGAAARGPTGQLDLAQFFRGRKD
ncbi:MAG: hypothetical protein JWO38_6183 [Gemmataceae bacterium]|nr:hypothetical protein [Gemmataceae bacterium]